MDNYGNYLEHRLPPVLTAEETLHFLEQAQCGNQTAKTKLILHNVRLVSYIINKHFQNLLFSDPSIDIDDLISIGVIGLMKAVETFDLSKNTKFATYSSRCIFNEVLMSARKRKTNIRVESIDDELLSDSDGNILTIGDTLTSDTDIQVDYENTETYQEVRDSLSILSSKECRVMHMHYLEEKSQLRIAKELSYSQSYVSRMEKDAKKKLVKHLARKITI